jgi:tetraacyldisaccharide 4'-kinase
MTGVLQRAWLRRGALPCILWPLSLLFGVVVGVRRAAYRQGLVQSHKFPVPVIVVGNVTAGGGGKTPIVLALLERLRALGLTPGVISRGYGRVTRDCRGVGIDSDPLDSGDEPLLIATRSRVPVFVGTNRVQAAAALMAAYPRTQVIVSDDGLQHYALARDIEICMFDENGIGNGWLLPAGPLREPWPRAVDLVVKAGSPPGVDGFTVQRDISPVAVRQDGTQVPLEQLKGRPLQAIAGIANPDRFFDMLRAAGLSLASTIPMPDHHDFRSGVPSGPDEMVCTEKDAVKIWRVRPDAWAVPLRITIEPAFWVALDRLLKPKLSSAHGSETS